MKPRPVGQRANRRRELCDLCAQCEQVIRSGGEDRRRDPGRDLELGQRRLPSRDRIRELRERQEIVTLVGADRRDLRDERAPCGQPTRLAELHRHLIECLAQLRGPRERGLELAEVDRERVTTERTEPARRRLGRRDQRRATRALRDHRFERAQHLRVGREATRQCHRFDARTRRAQRDVAQRAHAGGPLLQLRPQLGRVERRGIDEVLADLDRERAMALRDRDERDRIARRLERAATACADQPDFFVEIAGAAARTGEQLRTWARRARSELRE